MTNYEKFAAAKEIVKDDSTIKYGDKGCYYVIYTGDYDSDDCDVLGCVDSRFTADCICNTLADDYGLEAEYTDCEWF